MADSYNFNFKINDNFWRDINKKFDLSAMNGEGGLTQEQYKLVLLSNMSTSFTNLVDSNGYLVDNIESLSGVDILTQPELVLFHLSCTFTGVGFAIMVDTSVDIQFDDSSNNYVHAILLVKHETNARDNEGYVLAWAKASNPIRVRDAISIPMHSQIAGVGNCDG